MTGFEPRTSGVRSNSSTIWATTTAPISLWDFLLDYAIDRQNKTSAQADLNVFMNSFKKSIRFKKLKTWKAEKFLNFLTRGDGRMNE